MLAVLSVASPAGAAGTVTINPNPITVAPGQTEATVSVGWTGQAADTLMFVNVCNKTISDPTFNVAENCSALSELNPNGTADGSNTIQMPIFRGENPDGDTGWGCFAAGDTAPAGVTKNTTCFVRVTNNSVLNQDDAEELAFTFTESSGVVPEAPLTILLPVLGTLAALGGFVLIRRRQATV
jgi:hypothetical protein